MGKTEDDSVVTFMLISVGKAKCPDQACCPYSGKYTVVPREWGHILCHSGECIIGTENSGLIEAPDGLKGGSQTQQTITQGQDRIVNLWTT